VQILKKATTNWYLGLIPIAIFVVGLMFAKPMFPIYLNSGVGYGPDAAYVYLFAAIDMLQGYSPAFTDHPGTPLQIMMAIATPAVWLVATALHVTSAGIIDSAVQNPEFYLFGMTVLLLFFTAAASYYLGIKLYRATADAGIALSCQLTPLLFPLVSPMMAYPTAESLLQSISLLLLATLVPTFYRQQNTSNSKFEISALSAGTLCGIGLATKLTFLPMLGLLFIFNDRRLFALTLVGLAAGLLLGVAPIIVKIPSMFKWYLDLASHSEVHGLGSRELFNFVKFKGNIGYLRHMFPLFYNIFLVVIVVFIAFLGWMKFNSKIKVCFLLGGAVLILVALFHTAMVAKHPGLPYMVAVLPIATFSVGYLLNTGFALLGRNSVSNKKFTKILSFVWVVILVYIAISSTVQAFTSLQEDRARAEVSHSSIAAEISRYDNPILVGTFNCSFKECATWFGIALSHGLDLRMDRVNPQFYYYDIFSKNLRIPGQAEALQELTPKTINHLLKAGHTLLLISPQYEQNSQFKLIELVKTPNQTLYRISGYN